MGVVLGQNLGQNRSNIVKKVKSTGIINRYFFHIFHGQCLLKPKVVIVQTLEWKFKENIARNTNLKDVRAKYLPDLES